MGWLRSGDTTRHKVADSNPPPFRPRPWRAQLDNLAVRLDAASARAEETRNEASGALSRSEEAVREQVGGVAAGVKRLASELARCAAQLLEVEQEARKAQRTADLAGVSRGALRSPYTWTCAVAS